MRLFLIYKFVCSSVKYDWMCTLFVHNEVIDNIEIIIKRKLLSLFKNLNNYWITFMQPSVEWWRKVRFNFSNVDSLSNDLCYHYWFPVVIFYHWLLKISVHELSVKLSSNFC